MLNCIFVFSTCLIFQGFSIAALDYIADYILINLLNLFELDWLKPTGDADGCRLFHIFPRFSRTGPGFTILLFFLLSDANTSLDSV